MSLAAQSKQLKQDFDKVYEAGKKAKNDEFWNVIQRNGSRTNYNYAFSQWSSEYIRPIHKIYISTPVQYMFSACTNLKELEPEYFDFSGLVPNYGVGTNGDVYALYNRCTNLEVARDLGIPACSYGWTYAYCSNLHTIEIMRVDERSGFTDCFANTPKLKNIVFEGIIGKNISFSYSPLTVESIKSVITHLKDYAGTSSEYSYTVTFKTSAFEALEAEGETSPNGNTWAEYIDDLKWNLALAE